MFELFKSRKGLDGVYIAMFIIGLILGLGVAYAALRWIPKFSELVGIC